MSEKVRGERRTIRYSGQVQGVGFRWSTARLAKGHAVTGYVRNLDDGCVELVVEGSTQDLDLFLAAVTNEFQSNIREAQTEVSPGTREFEIFEIRN